MRERLYFNVNETNKKEVAEALKAESKFTKKIPIVNNNGDVIAKVIKYDVYSSYIDFWLDEYIGENITSEPGKIQSITLRDAITSKGVKYKRVKSIVA